MVPDYLPQYVYWCQSDYEEKKPQKTLAGTTLPHSLAHHTAGPKPSFCSELHYLTRAYMQPSKSTSTTDRVPYLYK
jgi:hypothetical protein